jgi:hypothetical protein
VFYFFVAMMSLLHRSKTLVLVPLLLVNVMQVQGGDHQEHGAHDESAMYINAAVITFMAAVLAMLSKTDEEHPAHGVGADCTSTVEILFV